MAIDGVDFPDTAAGKRAAWFIETLRSGGDGLQEGDLGQLVPALKGTALDSPEGLRTLGPRAAFALLTVTAAHGNDQTSVVVKLNADREYLWEVDVDPRPPHVVSAMRLVDSEGIKLTALGCAVSRAVHRALFSPPVFDDDLAEVIGGAQIAAAVDRARSVGVTAEAATVNAALAARARFAEDVVVDAARTGVAQYVILGAGADTFAYRRPDLLEVLTVYEVDEPVTQAWKRRRAVEANLPAPSRLRFVPVDFAVQQLETELARAGFDARVPAVAGMLGVSYYLEERALHSTLRTVASWARGSKFVFDYWLPERAWDPFVRMLIASLALQGEPMHTFYEPDEVEHLLCQCGFSEVRQLDDDALVERYFSNRADGLRPHPVFRVVEATV